jgi:hypothetical protein
MNIKKEIAYIIKRAAERDGRIVRLGELLLFSTETGDAWVLDTVDHLALCLARDGLKQKFKIIDLPTQFGFDWEYTYAIDGDLFITMDQKGSMRTIFGYPVRKFI